MSTDDRPRPEYGEYASESEWASAVKRSGAELPEKQLEPVAPTAKSLPAPRQGRAAGNVADRFVTIFLLAFGLVYVISGVPGYFTLAETIQNMFDQLGAGAYTPTELTSVVGGLIVVSQSILWIAATVWSFSRLRQGRLAFWIPLAGGVVNFLISAILLGMLLISDPAFLAFATAT